MKKHLKKILPPVIVSICLICIYIAYGFFFVNLDIPNFIKLIVLIVSIIVAIVVVMVLIERIKEIKGGEEDDLGKY